MNIAFDLDGTVERHPEFYKRIMNKWQGKRFILTARPMSESFITHRDLFNMGIKYGEHYDVLLMNPLPHLFDTNSGAPIFWEDNFEVVYRDMNHRSEYINIAKLSGNKQIEHKMMLETSAKWKVQKCIENGIEVIFEDNKTNIEYLHKEGIYTLQVKGDYTNG